MATQTFMCAFLASVPVGHRVEVTTHEEHAVVESGGTTNLVQRTPAPCHPLVRDLETGIVYADERHFIPVEGGGWLEDNARRRDALREGLMLSETLLPAATLYGRVSECTVISNFPIAGDDRRTHTRLVVEVEPTGYRS